MEENTRQQSNKAAVVVPIPPLKDTRYFNRQAPCFGSTVGAQNPQGVFNSFIGTMLDKGKGEMLFVYGVEGFHWKKTGNTCQVMPSPSNPKVLFDKAYVEPALIINDWQLPIPLDPRAQLSRQIHLKNSDQLYFVQDGSKPTSIGWSCNRRF